MEVLLPSLEVSVAKTEQREREENRCHQAEDTTTFGNVVSWNAKPWVMIESVRRTGEGGQRNWRVSWSGMTTSIAISCKGAHYQDGSEEDSIKRTTLLRRRSWGEERRRRWKTWRVNWDDWLYWRHMLLCAELEGASIQVNPFRDEWKRYSWFPVAEEGEPYNRGQT